MAQRKLIWSKNAVVQLHEILMFYKQRNKSSSYSIKLYNRLNIELDKLLTHPELGVKTKFEKIRGLIVSNYILYYEISDQYITVLKVWDSRQNPNKLVFK
jgi:plasmid stabilization system protein ParE